MKLRFKNESVNRTFEKYDFSEFKTLMFDTGLGKEKVSKEEANNKIREIMYSAIGVDSTAKKKELRKALRRNKTAFFEVIEELIPDLLQTGWQSVPFFQEFVEYKTMNDGDTNEFYTPDEVLLTVSELSGNHHDLIRQTLGEGSTFRVKTSWYGVKIFAEFERFMAGLVDWAGFIQKVYEAFDRKINAMLYEATMAAGSKVLPEDRFNKNFQMTEENRLPILQLVQELKTLTGEDVVFMGTPVALAALDSIIPSTWITDGMREERHTTGRIGLWEGITKVEIPVTFEKGSVTNKITDNNRILIMPVGDNKFIKMYDEGDTDMSEVTDKDANMDYTMEFEYKQKMGVATVINKKFGQINIVTG